LGVGKFDGMWLVMSVKCDEVGFWGDEVGGMVWK